MLRSIFILGLLLPMSLGAYELEGVGFIAQKDRFCGPAALASVMSYHGLAIDQDTIAQEVYNEKLAGALITDLENFARSRGFTTRLDQGSVADIRTFLDEKTPVIVLVDLGFWVYSRPHYLVVTGYTAEGVIAHTGYEASLRFSTEKFEKIWRKMGSVYLLVSP
ncbi:MAG: cysteine peptidase family C39 domain-containing protein [Desulfomonilia bacterium]|nr:cysteine peptidase family C39 domain-containing protein [Desulfomonilia bacterium]